MTDTAPQVGAMEQWLIDHGCADASWHPTLSGVLVIARERDAAYAALERQRDALLAALEPILVLIENSASDFAITVTKSGWQAKARRAIAAVKAGTP